MLYKYLVMEGRYNYDAESADVLFATNEKAEAIEAAKDFGQGVTVISMHENGKSQKNLASMYQLEKDEKLPGPKDLNHIKAKEEAKATKEQARKERKNRVN